MIYQQSVLIPAQTPVTAPIEQDIPVVAGNLERCWIGFPRGCAGLVHAQLWRAGTILVPFRSEESLAWDDYLFDMPIRLLIVDEPRILRLRAWNDDDSYAHRVFVMLSVIPLPEWAAAYGLEGAVHALPVTVEV